jgi:Restriction endonuclease XhoI
MAEPVFRDAVRHFWARRQGQADEQVARGMVDQGLRGAATGGKHMDGFVLKVVEAIRDAGCEPDHIFSEGNGTYLPGFFRPSKKWDVVVVEGGRLLAAVELKSHVGPSFGNNANNRAEEAIGNAVDVAAAFRTGIFGRGVRPWLGYLVLVEDCPGSRAPVRSFEPHFPVLGEMSGASYARRYELLGRRLVSEQYYDASCVLVSERAKATRKANYSEPASDLGGENFLASLAGHIIGALK